MQNFQIKSLLDPYLFLLIFPPEIPKEYFYKLNQNIMVSISNFVLNTDYNYTLS